eukprot:scaffold5907_cov120-Isochrysis_galbana.AAC.20
MAKSCFRSAPPLRWAHGTCRRVVISRAAARSRAGMCRTGSDPAPSRLGSRPCSQPSLRWAPDGRNARGVLFFAGIGQRTEGAQPWTTECSPHQIQLQLRHLQGRDAP